MAYSALLVQRRGRAKNAAPVWEAKAQAIRIPTVTGVHTIQDTPGGYLTADFTIPAEHARIGDIPWNTQCWLFDGLHQMFMGYVTTAIPARNGDVAVTLAGSYQLLSRTFMREVWADGDITVLQQAVGSAQGQSATIDSNGDLLLTFVDDNSAQPGFPAGAYIAMDYLLFGEAIGPRDGKVIDGFRMHIGSVTRTPVRDNYTAHAALELRIYGMSGPGDTSPTLIQTFGAVDVERMQISDTSHGADNALSWTNPSGYRCIRVGLYATTGGNTDRDFVAKITKFIVTTRGRSIGMNIPTTSTIVQDLWESAALKYDVHQLCQEEHAATTGEMIVGNIPSSGVLADGINFPAWSTPQEIVESTAAIDGGKVGMWLPTKRPPVGSHVVSAGNTSVNYWMRQPAELTYEAWGNLSNPDYIIHLQAGAVWTPDGQADELVSGSYAEYQSRKNAPLSVFSEDTTAENRRWEEGWHEAQDWQIIPPVRTQTAQSLADQFNAGHRQPFLRGTITIYGDRPGSIEGNGGVRITKLSTIRPGVCRIPDAKGSKGGIITAVDYSARSATNPEMVILSVNNPAASRLARRQARIANRANRQRNR